MNYAPFLRSNNTTHKMMKNLFLALLPIILFFIYKNGIVIFLNKSHSFLTLIYPLLRIMIASIISIMTELIYFKSIKKTENLDETLRQTYPIFEGLILSLLIPFNTNIFILIFCTIITSIMKILMYRYNLKLVNSILIGCLIGTLIFKIFDSKDILTGTLNEYNTIKDNMDLWDYFIGSSSYISPLICIISYVFLVYKKAIKWKIPIIYISTIFILSWIIGKLNGFNIEYVIYAVCSGPLIFSSIFLLPESSTSPMTAIGQIIYAIFSALLTITFRFIMPFNGGIILSILIMNFFVPHLDIITSFGNTAIKKIIIPLILCILLSIILIIRINKVYKLKSMNVSNYHIIESYLK